MRKKSKGISWIEDWWEPFCGIPTLKYLGTHQSSGYVIDTHSLKLYHVEDFTVPYGTPKQTVLSQLAPYQCGQW